MSDLIELKKFLESGPLNYNDVVKVLGWSKKNRKKNKQLL